MCQWGPEVKVREVLSGRGLREKTQTPFIPYRIPTGVPMRVGFGICQGRRLCRLRDGNGWRCLWAPGWARAHGQRGASCGPAQIWGPEVKVREVLSGRGLREKTQTPFIPYRIPTGVPMWSSITTYAGTSPSLLAGFVSLTKRTLSTSLPLTSGPHI